ncbi:MAG: hypothetical protein ACMUIS_00325 [bacterium]
MEKEKIIELDLGITPEAAISGPVLLQTDYSTFLTFNAMKDTDKPFPDGGYYKEEAGTAIVELIGCQITKFGYPNDEAWAGIPRTKGLSYGIYEVINSKWIRELAGLNRYSFPDSGEWDSRHFLFLFHDSCFECIADDLKIEISKEKYEDIFAKLSYRVLSE